MNQIHTKLLHAHLISSGVSYDFFSKVNPKLEVLGPKVGRYWQVHKEIDQKHLAMGLDLIPQCAPDSPIGKTYARIAWEMATLYAQMLDSWGGISKHHNVEPSILLDESIQGSSISRELAVR